MPLVNIFVDESGTFRTSPHPDSWCTVVAYVSPEIDRAPFERLVQALRVECSGGKEAKINDLSEGRYERFLTDLAQLHGIAFAVAIDAHLHSEKALENHRDGQAEKVVQHIDKMIYPDGRQAIQDLSDAIRSLPVQLYTQLVCQVELFHKIITRAIAYYVQRYPATLGSLRWRVDRKDTIPTAYESAFRRILPALLQTKSSRDPMLILKGENYRFFKRFEFEPGKVPQYLKEDYGVDHGDDVADVGKMVRDDFRLVDSNLVPGVQVADLLASGLRRTMRRQFENVDRIATLLGANMLREAHHAQPVRLITLSDGDDLVVSDETARLLKAMTKFNRPYLA